MKKEEKSAEKLATRKQSITAKIDRVKSQLSDVGFSTDEFDKLESEKVELEDTIRNTQDVVDALTAKLQGRLSFQYSDPVRGFDRSKVKGIVAKLIEQLVTYASTRGLPILLWVPTPNTLQAVGGSM